MGARTESTFGGFLEAAMGHQPLEAFLDQLLRFLVLQLLVRFA
jgi:hypothetical protein